MSRARSRMRQVQVRISRSTSLTLIREIRERVMPVLTHERSASTMRVPAHPDDDDLYVSERLRELKRRIAELEANNDTD